MLIKLHFLTEASKVNISFDPAIPLRRPRPKETFTKEESMCKDISHSTVCSIKTTVSKNNPDVRGLVK